MASIEPKKSTKSLWEWLLERIIHEPLHEVIKVPKVSGPRCAPKTIEEKGTFQQPIHQPGWSGSDFCERRSSPKCVHFPWRLLEDDIFQFPRPNLSFEAAAHHDFSLSHCGTHRLFLCATDAAIISPSISLSQPAAPLTHIYIIWKERKLCSCARV